MGTPKDGPINNDRPSDGQRNTYMSPHAKSTDWFDMSREVVFVNGMLTKPKEHAKSALALSYLQMCKVAGIYNASRGITKTLEWETAKAVAEDLVQCAGDKLQWDSSRLDRAAVNLNTWYQSKFGNPVEAVRYVERWLSRNPPALRLFEHIRERPGQRVTIFAHSQGNLITSNALTGLYLLDPQALRPLTVNSYGSPAVFWPQGFTHNRYAYTLDPVALLFGFGNSLSLNTSTIGGVISHRFKYYRRDDATFVVNQFRWGMLRMTLSLNEDGLASALAGMGRNVPRIYKIFVRLAEVHPSDVDDVAVLYVEKIKNRPGILQEVKADAKLRELLIKSMGEGWTSSRENAAIDLLRSKTGRRP